MLKTQSIFSEVLLRVLPIMALVSLLFFAVLIRQEWQRLHETNQQIATVRTENLANLLREPLWQFSDVIINNVLSTNLSAQTLCLQIQDEFANILHTQGDCLAPEGEWFSSTIRYQLNDQLRDIGQLNAKVITRPNLANLSPQLTYLSLLTLLLFISLSLAALWAFRKVVLLPLSRVTQSLSHYRQTKELQPVAWQSHNELGQFVALFNQSIELQDQYQQQLLAAKTKAEQALDELKLTQAQLIHSEKMASLGSIVAGIAHEINTPIGNSLTVASTLSDKLKNFQQSMAQGLRKSTLDQFLGDVEEASNILTRSLNMAAEQVANFKQVAVDQTSEQKRPFELGAVIKEVLSTLRPSIKHKDIQVLLELESDLLMNSYPGPLGQVISNCFNNSVLHGLDNNSLDNNAGQIRICARQLTKQEVELVVADNGKGMTEEQLARAMDPFFTTKLGQGGSGLGLHLVYQLVSQTLKGKIRLESHPNQGFRVILQLPNDPNLTMLDGPHAE